MKYYNKKIIYLYWKEQGDENSNFDLPVENSWISADKEKVIKEINFLYNQGSKTGFHGSSICRICGKTNGNFESVVTLGNIIFIIPSGYIHYLKDHNVMPNVTLMEYIDGLINFDVSNPLHICEVISGYNHNIDLNTMYQKIVEKYKNEVNIYGFLKYVNKFAIKNGEKIFRDIDFFKIGTLIKRS